MNLDEVTPSEIEMRFVPGPYEATTIEDWHEVVVYAPWSDKVRATNAATFGDYRGAWIARLHFNDGVATREQAEANARLLKAAPALYEALGYVGEVAESVTTRGADDSDTANITVTVGWLREVKEALSLVDGPQKD